jgi:glycosyltransferase involved in cell wall biosynthesis
MSDLDLTVITPTWKRPKFLKLCCEQMAAQSIDGVSCEHIIVSDGPDERAERIARRYGARFRALNEHYGHSGAYCRDMALAMARGRYVVFFDDDNFYRPHALASLYAAAQGVDIGVCRTVHCGIVIPDVLELPFRYGQIDSMCVCVRRSLACREDWRLARRATDIRWLERLATHKPTVRFVPIIIGEHLK